MPVYTFDGYMGRTDMFFADPAQIHIVPGHNPRTENEMDIDSLIPEIIGNRNEVHTPLTCRLSEGRLLLVDGERRLRAVLKINSEGIATIEKVPVNLITKKLKNDDDILLMAMRKNSGAKPLTPLEQALAIKKLHRNGTGMSYDDIAKALGKSRMYIYNQLKLLDADAPVQEALAKGEITKSDVKTIVKEAKQAKVPQSLVLKQIAAKSDGRKKAASAPLLTPAQSKTTTSGLTAAEKQERNLRNTLSNLIDTLGIETVLQWIIDAEGEEYCKEVFTKFTNEKFLIVDTVEILA